MWRVLAPALLVWMAWGCSGDLRVTVLYDQSRGLQPGDRVLMGADAVGQVEKLTLNPSGQVAVALRIKAESREKVTDRARFLIQSDPQRPGHRAVELVQVGQGGRPLADGAEVKGASSLSVLLERGGQELSDWARHLRDERERWEKELRQLPDKEWYRQLERDLESYGKELERGGEDLRRYLDREILPRLEDALKELRKRLEREGKGREAEPLERKLEQIKRI